MKISKELMFGHDLTKAQMDVLLYIRKFMVEKGYSPRVLDIQRYRKNNSPSPAIVILTILEEKGYIERDSENPRIIKLLK